MGGMETHTTCRLRHGHSVPQYAWRSCSGLETGRTGRSPNVMHKKSLSPWVIDEDRHRYVMPMVRLSIKLQNAMQSQLLNNHISQLVSQSPTLSIYQ